MPITKVTKLLKLQPTGVWYLILLSMWEYFSYYGMRALLILYLSGALLFSDKHAYALYGAYTALVYVTPMLGGVIADRYLGYRVAVVCGAMLMVLGHVFLLLTSSLYALYFALALIVCGYGLFKSNISCVLGRLYKHPDPRRESGFALMYVGGNIGAFIAPVLCAYVAHLWGWHYGFGLAGLGMAIGLVIFYFGRKHFEHLEKPASSLFNHQGQLTVSGIMKVVVVALFAALFFSVILMELWAGWLLAIFAVVTFYLLVKLFFRCNEKQRPALLVIIAIMLFCLVFWAFDQQGGSSISLFIQRNVVREFLGVFIPAADFQSINPAAVLIGGVFVAWLWRYLQKKNIQIMALLKIAIGMLILTAGFFFISFSAKLATLTGHVNMLGVVVGMLLIGFAELFIDPVALAEITRLNPANSVGFLAGAYMLFSGSFANFLAAKIAALTSVKAKGQVGVDLIMAAHHYYQVFSAICWACLWTTIILFIVAIVTKLLLRRKAV